MQEVSGSIPLSSTKFCTQRIWFVKKSCGAIAQLGERLHGMQEVSGSIPLSSTKICGAIAQLGERLHGMQEVSGSIPLSSTKIQNPRFGGGFCF